MVSLTAAESVADATPDRLKPVRIWLYVIALMVLAMVVVGGLTRLTGSGLSITEWKPITGIIPPLSEADWQAFDTLSKRCAMRRFGGDCYGYAQLAGGTIDLVVETGLQPYDYLGPAGLIEAAGGVITDWEGKPLGLASDGRVVAAATPELHRAALDLLRA